MLPEKKCVATDDQMGELKGDPEKCCFCKIKNKGLFNRNASCVSSSGKIYV